jgi:hypothetical protein
VAARTWRTGAERRPKARRAERRCHTGYRTRAAWRTRRSGGQRRRARTQTADPWRHRRTEPSKRDACWSAA